MVEPGETGQVQNRNLTSIYQRTADALGCILYRPFTFWLFDIDHMLGD